MFLRCAKGYTKVWMGVSILHQVTVCAKVPAKVYMSIFFRNMQHRKDLASTISNGYIYAESASRFSLLPV